MCICMSYLGQYGVDGVDDVISAPKWHTALISHRE